MSACVVVGGGVVGLLCALLARQRYQQVTLVEKSDSCGGLLGSFSRNGACYDYGTHIPAPTGVAELDALLYGSGEERKRDYHSFPYLLSENFHNGHWYPSSPLIDARTLSPDLYHRGMTELLLAEGAPLEERNLYRYLRATFGETFTESIYRPVMRKVQGEDLENLERDVLRLFGLQRLIALTPEATRKLKAIPGYDASLGFHSYTEGAVAIPYIYPRGNGGIGAWPARLEHRVRELGCDIRLGESVNRIRNGSGRVDAVVLAGGDTLPCDRLIWTIPPIFACRAAGIEVGGGRPAFRSHTLVHLRYAQPFLKHRPQYLLCWEPTLQSYRITLYPNITPERNAAGVHNLTVEVLGGPEAELQTAAIAQRVERELVEISVVARENPVVDSAAVFLGPSFPVLTPAFVAASKEQCTALKSCLANLDLLGRGSAAFFINDLLLQAWHSLKENT